MTTVDHLCDGCKRDISTDTHAARVVAGRIDEGDLLVMRFCGTCWHMVRPVLHFHLGEVHGIANRHHLENERSQASLRNDDLKVGDQVQINAPWSRMANVGIVEEVDPLGFRIRRIWFGWHELVRIVQPAAERTAPHKA